MATPAPTELEELVAYLEKNRPHYDVPNSSVIEELGFSLALHKGQNVDTQVGLIINCGGWSRVPNLLMLFVPPRFLEVGTVDRRCGDVIAAIRAIAEVFEPESASTSFLDRFRSPKHPPLTMDWISYIRAETEQIVELAPPSWSEPAPGGVILAVQPQPVDWADPREVGRFDLVVDAARRAGLTAG
jgi:hypothetical protein